ncbi:MAG: hypothetical protein HY910_06135 [Desulfarculus sp.]|nr:hypothetical protein [Desulfarculus sp.]
MPAGGLSRAVLCLAGLWAVGCQPGQDLPGKYLASHPEDPGSQVVLVLQPAGKGSWSYSDEEVPLRWEARGGEVWLHLKGGGLLAGRPDRDAAIKLELPGYGDILFQRAGPRE